MNLEDVLNFIKFIFNNFFKLASPLIIGLVIAYLLDPIADFFQKKWNQLNSKKKVPSNSKRAAGTAFTYLAILLIILISSLITIKKIGSGNSGTIEGFANVISSSVEGLSDMYTNLQITLNEWGIFSYVEDFVVNLTNSIAVFAKDVSLSLTGYVTKAGSGVVNFFLGFVIAFYFLKDKNTILKNVSGLMDTFLPDKINKKLKTSLEDINIIFSGYIRGQLTDAFIMATLISISLSLINIKYAILIGVISGFSNVIPFFGAIIGFVLAVSTGLLSGEPIKALYAAIAMLVLQQVDTIFIVPKVVGENVELHPVVVLLSLSVAGYLFGIGGMILAVPVVAIIKMFLLRYIDRKRSAI